MIALMMNRVKCRDTDDIDFMIAGPKIFSCTEDAKVQPKSSDPSAHDVFTRLLPRATSPANIAFTTRARTA
jgi:putative transposase